MSKPGNIVTGKFGNPAAKARKHYAALGVEPIFQWGMVLPVADASGPIEVKMALPYEVVCDLIDGAMEWKGRYERGELAPLEGDGDGSRPPA